MRVLAFPVELTQAPEDGVWLAHFPDLDVTTDGETREDALREAQGCLDAGLTGFLRLDRAIPDPSPANGRPLVAPDPLIAAKVALRRAQRAAGVSNVELARRLGVTEGAVRALLDPARNASIDKLQSAMSALGQRLVISTVAA